VGEVAAGRSVDVISKQCAPSQLVLLFLLQAINPSMSVATARGQALDLSPGSAVGYVSALRMLEEFAVRHSKSLLSASALLLAEFAAETNASFALIKRAAAAWRWMRVSAGMEPPSFVGMQQAVRQVERRGRGRSHRSQLSV
jgi:hypothetical protein